MENQLEVQTWVGLLRPDSQRWQALAVRALADRLSVRAAFLYDTDVSPDPLAVGFGLNRSQADACRELCARTLATQAGCLVNPQPLTGHAPQLDAPLQAFASVTIPRRDGARSTVVGVAHTAPRDFTPQELAAIRKAALELDRLMDHSATNERTAAGDRRTL